MMDQRNIKSIRALKGAIRNQWNQDQADLYDKYVDVLVAEYRTGARMVHLGHLLKVHNDIDLLFMSVMNISSTSTVAILENTTPRDNLDTPISFKFTPFFEGLMRSSK